MLLSFAVTEITWN